MKLLQADITVVKIAKDMFCLKTKLVNDTVTFSPNIQ